MVLNGSGGLLAVSGLRPGDRMLDGGRGGWGPLTSLASDDAH